MPTEISVPAYIWQNAGFIIRFSPINDSTRYSTYSVRNKVASSPLSLVTPDTPVPQVEHAELNLLASEFFAFKVLPREFIAPGARTAVSDSDDEYGIEAENGETCKAVTEKVVKRIHEQCKRLSVGLQEGFLIDEDVVRRVTLLSPNRCLLTLRIA